MYYPRIDLARKYSTFCCYCNVSRVGLGCVLMKKDKVISYASR